MAWAEDTKEIHKSKQNIDKKIWEVSFRILHFIGCHSRMFLSGISLRAH
jgi:hypothetical protein